MNISINYFLDDQSCQSIPYMYLNHQTKFGDFMQCIIKISVDVTIESLNFS